MWSSSSVGSNSRIPQSRAPAAVNTLFSKQSVYGSLHNWTQLDTTGHTAGDVRSLLKVSIDHFEQLFKQLCFKLSFCHRSGAHCIRSLAALF